MSLKAISVRAVGSRMLSIIQYLDASYALRRIAHCFSMTLVLLAVQYSFRQLTYQFTN